MKKVEAVFTKEFAEWVSRYGSATLIIWADAFKTAVEFEYRAAQKSETDQPIGYPGGEQCTQS